MELKVRKNTINLFTYVLPFAYATIKRRPEKAVLSHIQPVTNKRLILFLVLCQMSKKREKKIASFTLKSLN